ncbi:MAG: TraR/DksA C4-type zinc finger protein [Ginsengibacter sp.]
MATKKKETAVTQKFKATKGAVKKAVAKKAVAQKVVAKKVVAKKVVAKKAVAKKLVAKKPVVKATNKKAIKVATQKKAAFKLSKDKKSSKVIKKQAPVKKAAKAGVKKAVPNKLATSKKSAVSKPVVTAKKTAKKDNINTKKSAPVKKDAVSKPIQKNTGKSAAKPVGNVNEHKAELKKAIAKVKFKKNEEKKSQKVFVMPKTSTEKARKYEPEFTKSVLDQSPAENNGPTMRYSDGELIEFRELITRKLETAKKELGYLQGLITRKDQMGGDESDNRYMTMEDGSLSMEREQLSQMASRQITFIDHLEKAMMRIENKTYGICRVTGKLIDKARLRAVPHATLSIEAKMGIAR